MRTIAMSGAAMALRPAMLAAEAKNGKQPNIVFVLADDMGWGDAGFNGQKKIMTPCMDQMAQDGATFNNFYAAAPVCGPSRASLMTGKHMGHCKVRGNPHWTVGGLPEFDDSDMMISKELKRAGYATGFFGKWGLDEASSPGSGYPTKQGFDEFLGFRTHREAHFHWPDYVWRNDEKVDLGGSSNWKDKKQYADDLFTDEAVDFIKQHAGKEPFFVYLSYTIPHFGISVPTESQEPYKSKGWPKRKARTANHYRNDPNANVSYAGMISHMDAYLGRIRKLLKEKGIADNTILFFTSDNGHEYDNTFFDSNGPYSGKKRSLKEGGIKMPTVAIWPKTMEPGMKIDEPLAFWDILPTFCDMAGIKPSKEHDGISFLPAMKGQKDKQQSHEYLYWEFNEKGGPMQAMRMGKWKGIRHGTKDGMGPVRLYDLENDIPERNNLSKQHPDIAKKITRLIESARTEHPNFPLVLHKRAKAKRKPK